MDTHTNKRNIGHNRRTFLKAAGLIPLWFIGLGCRRRAKIVGAQPEFSQTRELVAVEAVPKGVDAETVITAVRRVAEAATDFAWLSRGDVVFIKPAANSAYRYPATTSPLAIRAMVGLVREKGAGRVIVGDRPGVQSVYQDAGSQRGTSRAVLSANGLQQAALNSGAEIHYFDEAGWDAYFADTLEHENHWKGDLMLPKILNHVDHIISLPRVSRHALAGTTLGLKSAVGWPRDDCRLELHRDAESFYEKTAEINDARTLREKLRLTLSVATKVQTTFGPDRGFAAEPDPGLIFGSESLMAHDMAALGWLLWNRKHTTPAAQLSWYRDPYTTYPGAMNRIFVGTIWGVGAFFETESYASVPIRSARSDPVLARAASIWGGFPRLDVKDVGGALPQSIQEFILEKAAL